MESINIFWFRRDLRLYDNMGLSKSTEGNLKVFPLFIFDTNITDKLPRNDSRINFIYDSICRINEELTDSYKSALNVYKGDPLEIFRNLIQNFKINTVYTNNDYEPYAIKRDDSLKKISF